MNFLGDWITPHGSEGNGTAPENILFNNCCARSNVAFVPAGSIHTLTRQRVLLADIHYITRLTAKISSILGFKDKAAHYHEAADKLAAAVNARFASSSGVYLDLLQTHSLMPLATGLVPAALENQTRGHLERQILVADQGHLDTGLTGTYFLFKHLMEIGRNDLLFTIANQT